MPLPLSSAQIAAACAVAALGSLLQGSVGFGASLVAAPLLVLVDPLFVPGPTIVFVLFLAGLISLRERRSMDLTGLSAAMPGLLIGSTVAAFVLTLLSADSLGVALGVLVLVAVALSVAGLRVRATFTNVFYASMLAGFMNTTASIPGPPLPLLYQHSAAPRLRATLAPLFVLCGVISLATLAAVGRFGWTELKLGLLLAPGALVGVFVSTFTVRLLDRGSVRYAVLIVAAAAGIAALWQRTG